MSSQDVTKNCLNGVVLERSDNFVGSWKVLSCPTEQFNILQDLPGVWHYENERSPDLEGWYVPQSLRDAGRFGKSLFDYVPDAHTHTPSGLQLHEYQRRAITCMRRVAPVRGGMLLAGDMGLGKAQPISCLTVTPQGLRPHGELQPGDQVSGIDGRPTDVIACYPQGVKKVWRVYFSDNTSTRCTMDHLWIIRTVADKMRGHDYTVRPLGSFAWELKNSQGHNRFHIPVLNGPVIFTERDNDEATLLQQLAQCLQEDTTTVKALPDDLIYGSVETRISLIQQLVDTIGGVYHKGKAVRIYSRHLCLMQQLQFIMHSLGGLGHINPVKSRTKKNDGIRRYCLVVRAPHWFVPTIKSAEIYQAPKRAPLRTIERVEPVGEEECVCIKVAANDGAYLTEHCLVTHNTITTLQALYLDGYLERAGLICSPLPGKPVWCSEKSDALVHYGLQVTSLEGITNIDPSKLAENTWVYANYDIIRAWHPWIFQVLRPASIILDEAHYLSNGSAKRSSALHQLSLGTFIERRYLLTGTPVENARIELWNLLALAQPRQWGKSKHTFGVRYCAGEQDDADKGAHWQYKGESNTEELGRRLGGTLLSYTKAVIGLNGLPELHRHRIEVEDIEPEVLAEYHEIQTNFYNYLVERKGTASALVQQRTMEKEYSLQSKSKLPVHLMYQTECITLLSKMKRSKALELTRELLQDHSHIVIFTLRAATASWLHRRLAKQATKDGTFEVFGPVTGASTKIAERRAIALEFSAAKRGVFVSTRGAAGISLNELVCASAAIFVDLYWNPTNLMQAEARLHREGNLNKGVDIYYLIRSNTMDTIFLEMLERKAHVAAAVTGDKASDIVDGLAPKYKKGLDLNTLCSKLEQVMDFEQ